MAPGRRDALILGGIGLGAALAGSLVGALALQSRSGAAGLLAAGFSDLSGRPRRLRDWQGRILVVNFWATWCAPCREEVPMLAAARQHYEPKGIEIVGIGIDNAAKIGEFAKSYAVSYPLLVADATAVELMHRLGNQAGGLPYTVFLDRLGALAHRKLGALTRPELDEILARMLR